MARPLSPPWLAAVGLLACTTTSGPLAERLTLEVAPQTVPCVAEAPRRCLMARRLPDGEWGRFFDPIEGFTHEAGYRVRLEVERRRVEHPPQDGSSFTYRLVRVVSREAAP